VAGFYRTCVIDGILQHSPAEHVRRPAVPAESPTLGFTHLQFEALLTASRQSADPSDFALVAMLGLLGLRIFEATSADIGDLGEEHGHRVLRVCGKGTKVVLVPLPPAVGRAIDRATSDRVRGPILLNRRGTRMDRHAATRRLHRLAETAGIQVTRAHPHMLRHTFVICTAFSARGTTESGLAASCLTSIRYSVRHVRQDRYQGLSLFAAAFDLTWLTCLRSGNGRLPGTLRFPVQITYGTELASAGIDLLALRELMGHANPETTAAYVHLSPETLAAEYARARAAAR
jgi:integrase/recombinase XerD